MHTTEELSAASFTIELGGRRSGIEEVFPGFDRRDRLGIVIDEPLGAIGASTLLLAAVTAFYDIQRRSNPDFWIYPDYFAFLTRPGLGTVSWFEFHPSHKEVVVTGGPEPLLEAINDRGITRLLVPDGPSHEGEYERESLASYRDRVQSAIAYSPQGRTSHADIAVWGDARTEHNVHNNVAGSAGVSERVREALLADRARLTDDGRPHETFRRIGLGDALGLLPIGPHPST